MNRMKKIVAIILSTAALILSACKGETGNKVIFLNHIPNTFVHDIAILNNIIHSEYELDAEEDALYAFCIEVAMTEESIQEIDHTNGESREEYIYRLREFRTQKVLEILEGKDLKIISEYPYCFYNQPDNEKWTLGLCAVAGTYQQIKALFDNTEPINGYYLRLWSAPRPDYLDKMRNAGWNGNLNGEDPRDWANRNIEKMERLVGNENQVTKLVDFEIIVK